MASEFDSVLARYKASMTDYKVTGQSASKTQADNAERWLREYISALNTSIQNDAAYIDRFAREYENTNPELVKYKEEIAKARKKGPELQDIYEGEKEVYAEPPVDEYLYYTKAAVVAGILAVGAVVAIL
jgi:hypothetical protein